MKIKNTYKKILATTLFCMCVFGVLYVPAVLAVDNDKYVPLAPLPGTTYDGTGNTDLQKYLPGAFNLLIGLSLVLAVLMIIFGGVQYMSTDAVFGKKEGKERITAALLGLLIVLGAFLLLQTIDTNLVNFQIINTPDSSKATTPTKP